MVEPKNIAVIEDEEKIWVKFALPGYMESCQMYRKMGHYTDVKIHCLHKDSEDVTIFSAHNLLLSAASTYFSFVLSQAFTQLTDLRTNNLKKVLHIIEDDHTFADKSISAEKDTVKFNVPLYHKDPSSYSQSHVYEKIKDTVKNSDKNASCSTEQTGEREIFSVILKSFNSANNIIMVVRGIDPVYFKYILNCIYSESFSIEKHHIQMFLSFVVHIELTNFATLATLLEPFIVKSACHREKLSAPVASSYINSNKNFESKSAFKLFENRKDYLVLNSSYDTHQWKDTNEFRTTLLSSTPLDLSCKSLVKHNNNHNNYGMFPSSSEQFADRMCRMPDSEALKMNNFDDSCHNSIYKNLNQHQWYFNYEETSPMPTKNITNASCFSSANNWYLTRPDLYFQKVNGIDPFWQGYANYNLNNGSHSYVPYINPVVSANQDTLLNMKENLNEPKFSFSNEVKASNSDYNVASSSNGPNSISHCDTDNPQILQRLKRNSSLEVKQLDVPVDFEGGLKNRQQPKRKITTDQRSNIKVTKEIKFDYEDHFTKSCSSIDNSDTHISTNTDLPSEMGREAELYNNEHFVNSKMAKSLLNNNDDSTEKSEVEVFKCFLCEYSSQLINEVISHMRSSHFSRSLRISKCVDSNCPVQLLFTSKEWETHIQHHFIKYFYQCSTCTYSTKTKKGILRHEMTHKSSYKRIPKVEIEKIYCKKANIKKKCTLSRSCVTSNIKKARLEQLTGNNPSSVSEIVSSNVFNTPTFKKFQKGLKRGRRHSAMLHRLHLQIAKLTKSKRNIKDKKYHTKKGNSASGVIEPKGNGSIESEVKVSKENNACKNESLNKVEKNAMINGVTNIHCDDNICTSIPSISSKTPTIKTKTVRVLNKKKPKIFHCSLCNDALSSEENMISHYYNSHNLILPFKCPYRNCDIYLDDTSLLYSHMNIHSGGELLKLQINVPTSSSSDTSINHVVDDSSSLLGK